MSDLCRLAALEAEVKLWAEVKAARARIEALEAERDAVTNSHRVLAAADLASLNRAEARIETLEAAGKRLADTMEASGWIEFMGDEFGFRTALAAWRAAEKGGLR